MDPNRSNLISYVYHECRVPNETYFDADCVEIIGGFVHKFLSNMTPTQDWIFSTLYGLVSALGLLGNGAIIALFLCCKKVRTIQNFLITNLAFANFLMSAMVYPLLWQPDRARAFSHGSVLCKLSTAFPGINLYCSTATIAVMAIDRYYATVRHRTRRSSDARRFILWMTVGVWVLSSALSLPLFYFYDLASYPKNFKFPVDPQHTLNDFSWEICILGPELELDTVHMINIVITCLQICFLYLAPLLILTVFNFRLSHAVSAQHERTLFNMELSASTSNLNLVQRTPSPTPRLLKSNRRHRRLRTLLVTMSLSYAALWTPFNIVSALIHIGYFDGDFLREHNWVDHASKFISMLSLVVNPFLYGYLNLNFKKEFIRIFRRIKSFLLCRSQTAEIEKPRQSFNKVPRKRSNTEPSNFLLHPPTSSDFTRFKALPVRYPMASPTKTHYSVEALNKMAAADKFNCSNELLIPQNPQMLMTSPIEIHVESYCD